jgi:hypothetical protein
MLRYKRAIVENCPLLQRAVGPYTGFARKAADFATVSISRILF